MARFAADHHANLCRNTLKEASVRGNQITCSKFRPPRCKRSRSNATFEVTDQPDAFFSRDVVNPVDDCCFQVIDGLRLSQEHPIFQVVLKIEAQA